MLGGGVDWSLSALQDPVLFTDTVRKNLDPFNQHTDEDLWRALQEVRTQSEPDRTVCRFTIMIFWSKHALC